MISHATRRRARSLLLEAAELLRVSRSLLNHHATRSEVLERARIKVARVRELLEHKDDR